MARVTVEDCLRNVKNRFELVIVAAKRARQLMRGQDPKVEWDNDKATVVALREIAAGYTNIDTTDDNAPEAPSLHANIPVMIHDHDDDLDDEPMPRAANDNTQETQESTDTDDEE